MSHPPYNPYASGNQSSTQGQYGLSSTEVEMDPWRASSHLGPGPSVSSSGASETPANSRGMLPSLLSQALNYRSEQRKAARDDNKERSQDMHITREEARVPGDQMHQPMDQGTHFTSAQSDGFIPLGTGTASYPMSSTSSSLGYGQSGFESSPSSLEWLSNYKVPTADDPSKFYSSSASSKYVGGGDGRFDTSSEREHSIQAIPGLSNFDYPVPDKPAAPTESGRPKYTSESASNILQRFGLDKEDLEHLVSFPEDQITPTNLPFILRQIRMEKAKRATTAVQSEPCLKPQHTRSVSEMESHHFSSSGGAGIHQEVMSSAVFQPSKVIDYGHTSKYTGELGDDIGRSSASQTHSGGSGSMLQTDIFHSSRHNREPLQKNATEVKSSAFGSSYDQMSSVSSLSSPYSARLNSVAPPSKDQTKRLQTQLKQTSHTIPSSFCLPKKDTDIRVFKSEAPKPAPLKEPEADRQLTSKSQPPSTSYCVGHPSRPGIVLFDSNNKKGIKDQKKTQGQEPTVAEQMKKQQTQQQPAQQQLKQQTAQQKAKQPIQQMQQQSKQQAHNQPVQQKAKQLIKQMQQQSKQEAKNQPVSQTGQAAWPPIISTAKSVPYASHPPSVIDATHHSVFIPGGPQHIVIPPAVPQPLLSLMNLIPPTLTSPSRKPPAKTAVSKALPTLVMMHDYAATTPKIFPHSCSLCNRECTAMKDWISHQNTTLHLENCKFLRTQYPDWDGGIALGPSAAGKDDQKLRRGSSSRSRSTSPRRRHGSKGRREKSRSCSRSPHSSRYSRRSWSRSRSPRYDRPTTSRYRSHSRSPKRRSDRKRSSSRRRDQRRSSPRRSRERRSSSRGSYQRRGDERPSPSRSSDERKSSPKRRDQRRSPQRKSNKRRSSSRSSDRKRSPSSSSDDRRSQLKTSDKRRSPQRKKLSSAESLAKKLLETPAVQSLSEESDLDSVVKTLAPALIAELAKIKSSPSSSSTPKGDLTPKPSKVKSSPQRVEATSSTKIKSGKSSAPTIVKLIGIYRNIAHSDVISAMEHFGKTKSVVLFRSRLEAVVCFEKEEDAKKLKSLKSIVMKGTPVIVARDKETSPREQKTPHRKPSSSSVSSPQTTTGAKKDTKDKLTDQESAAKGSVKGPSTTIEAKNVSTKQTTEMVKTEKDPKGVVGKQETSTGDKSTVSENQSDVKDSKLKETEVAEAQLKAELRKANDPKDAEPMEIGDIKVEVAEPTDFGSCAEGEGEKQTTTKAEPENSADKSSESRPPDSTDETGPTENAVKALPQSILSEPESTAQGPETKTEASHIQQQAAGSSTEADLEANLADPVTQTDATSAEDASAVTNPTIGEMLEKHLFQSKISCLKMKTCISPKFLSLTQKEHRLKQLLITNLPEYKNGCYTEDDVAKLLVPFGFQYADDNIHVVPQTGMAFILMQKVEDVPKTLKAFNRRKGITFKTSKPRCHAVANGITMTPLGFYKSLMKLIHFPVVDDGSKTVFVKNISWSEAEELRESLRKITQEPVKNYLPLLNKVFIEFESIRDADQFGVWYSLLKQGPDHEVHRLNVLNKLEASESPLESRFPRASIGPFWVTMRTRPFLFPTGDPWFNIPDYLTVRDLDDIEKAGDRGSTFSTVMLTGLPGFGHYKHEDVARLVWQYFPEQSFESLYYNVVVLPLQRRAFVFFSDWAKCCDFVRDHITNPVSVEGCLLSVHFVLEDMKPECSEEMMYKTLMKLSNAGDPEPESLEERLLCVVISETSLDVIRVVIEMVASITTFVSFLPLANRICIEMADSSGVTKVVENYNTFSPDSFKKGAAWSKVKRLEPLKSFKQHLQDSSEITVVFGPNTIYYRPKPPAVRGETQPPPSELSDNESKPALQTSGPGGSTMSKSVTAGPSATVASPSSFIDKAMKDDNEKPGTEITMDSTVARQANKDIEKAEVKVKEGSATTLISTADVTSTSVVSNANTVPTASSSAPSATVTTPEENFAATVHNYSLTQGSRSQSEDKEDPDDVKDNTVSSDAGVFDEKDFNMDDFVTVDEVSDEVGDKSPEHQSSSSSKQSSRARRGRQSSGALTTVKRISTRSVKESKSSSSSPSSSSTKGANSSSSVPPKQSKDSSELSKSPTKPSPPQSSETRSSPCQKTLISKTKPPAKASNTSSSGRSTRSSSAACVTEKITSASSVKASMETCSESAVTKSDQKVSADGLNAKTVESETQKETSSEMHPPLQDHGFELSQAKSPLIDANAINTKDQKKRKEEGNVDDKPTEVKEDNSKNYQILDSLDDQTDQQMDDVVQESSSEAQLSGPKEGQTLHEEIFQVLDSVDDCQDESSEKKMDRSVQGLHQAATGQGDSHLVQDDGLTEKKLSKKDIISAGDKSDWEGKNQETNIVATDCTQEPVHKGDGKRIKEEEVKGEMLSASKDVENPESRIQREDQLHQDPDNKDTLKDNASDAPDQETFKILDSIDDQTETEDVSQNLKKSSDQISKEDIKEDTCPIINSVKDQPTTTKTESETDGGKRNMRGEAMTTKDDSLSKRRGRTTTAPKKQDRTVKQCETRTKMDTTTGDSEKDKEVTEEMVYEIVDYIEDKPVPDAASTEMSGRRRSARGKKEDKVTLNLTEVPEKPEEVTYKILDSVEGETASDELIITRRSTRRKRERTPEKDASAEKTQKVDTPTRRRHTPARESQERNQEKTSKKEEKTSPKKSTSSKKTDNTSEISEEDIASVEREVVKDDRPTVRRKAHRGRPKKDVKSTKEGSTTFKEGDESEKVSDEEEIYQILDSVEDEISDDQPSTAHSKEKISKSNDQQANDRTSVVELTKHEEEEEEEEYQIIDSLEDDQAQEELTAAEDKTEDETPTKEEVSTEKVHTPTRGTTGVEASEKVDLKEQTLCQTVDDLEKANDDTAEASAIEYNPTTPKSDIKKEKKSTAKAQSDTATPEREKRQKSTEKDDTTSAPEMLYKVSKVDKAQEEELRKQQAAEKEKPFVKVQESRMSEDREQSIRSSSSGGEGGRGTRREKEKTVELDVKELVTLDEVGADEAAEDRAPQSREWDSEITEGELQELVTLDEFKEEEEAGKTEQSTVETCPPSQKDESVFFNPETLVALDEAIDDEEEKPDEEQTERTSRSAKRKRDDDTVSDGSINFVTVDKVGEVEEEEEMEAVKTRTRGRAKRTARQTPVRKSVRGKTAAAKNEGDEENEQPGADVQSPTSLDVSSSLDKDSSKLSRHNQLEIQKTEMEEAAASQTNISAASTGKEPQNSENKTPEGHMEEGWSTAETKGVSKRRKEPAGPEAKRSRSQSPSVASDVKLPPFKPNNPLGQEFMVPKLGYFCSVCSVFCPHESIAKDLHCSSREHYENLQKYYQKLKQKTSRSTTKSSQGSVSD